MREVQIDGKTRHIPEVGDPLYFPIWKDFRGNLFIFPGMPVKTKEEAEEAGRGVEATLWGHVFTFSHVFEMAFEEGSMWLDHVEADEIVPGLACVGGPVLDRARAVAAVGRPATVN